MCTQRKQHFQSPASCSHVIGTALVELQNARSRGGNGESGKLSGEQGMSPGKTLNPQRLLSMVRRNLGALVFWILWGLAQWGRHS